MIHRRILLDDYKGVEECLNETENNGIGLTQKMKHYLIFSDGIERNV